jgi:DNA-binding transcriptional LysR family regulator
MGRLEDLETFLAVSRYASFTLAGRRLGVTPSAVSKAIGRLEKKFGVQLVQRTTRTTTVTAEGASFAVEVARVFGELSDAELDVSAKTPRGKVRIDTTAALGTIVIAPALPRLLARFPELQVELTLRNQVINPVEEGVDVAIRIGMLEPSRLLSRPLGTTRFVTCASPAYLRKHGRPRSPADLAAHSCLAYVPAGQPVDWTFRVDGESCDVPVGGRVHSTSGEVIRSSALAGLGIAQLFDFIVASDLASGKLVPLLDDFASPPRPITAVLAPNRRLSARVRAVLDYFVDVFRARRTR